MAIPPGEYTLADEVHDASLAPTNWNIGGEVSALSGISHSGPAPDADGHPVGYDGGWDNYILDADDTLTEP